MSCQILFLTQKWEKTETLWKSSASVLTKNKIDFCLSRRSLDIPGGEIPKEKKEQNHGKGQEGIPAELWESQAGKKKKKHWKMTFFYLKVIGRVGKTNTKPRQIPEGPQLLKSHWKFLKIWAGISSSALGKAGLRQLGIPSWKRGTWQERVRNPNSHFGLFFHPGMPRDFGR